MYGYGPWNNPYNQPRAEQLEQSNPAHYLDELHTTLTELNKAVENINVMYRTAHSLGIFDMFKGQSVSSMQDQVVSLSNLLKNIDLDQVSELLQSPLVRQMLTDPEFFKLFSESDSESTDSTEDSNLEQNFDTNPS